jgi:pimeloyl-ACP methyl ester carboxylesterase
VTDSATLLSELRRRDVRLWIEGDRLKCSAPAGKLDAEMLEALASQKTEVMARLREAEALRNVPDAIVPINLKGTKPAVFFLTGDRENIFYIGPLTRHLGADQPVLVVQPPGYDGEAPLNTVEALARFQVERIRSFQPEGPYLLAGHCMGAPLAFEAARQLTAAGQQVALLAIIAARFPTKMWPYPTKMCRVLQYVWGATSGTLAERQRFIKSKLRHHLGTRETVPVPGAADPQSANYQVILSSWEAIRNYRPLPYAGQVDVFFSSCDRLDYKTWRAVVGTLRMHSFEFDVHELRSGPHVKILGASLQQRFDEAAAAIINSQCSNRSD